MTADQAQTCAQCGRPIPTDDEHYPHPDDCQRDDRLGWTAGTAPVHPDCCPHCNPGVPW